MCTLTSADTIPLGTDLDPAGYCNLWAGSKVQDPNARRLVESNLGWRVIDAENVGYSHGKEVLRLDRTYSGEGVRLAVGYFRTRQCQVIVVTKREETRSLEAEGVHIVMAERTDDVQVLKQAYNRNCPVVSRDGYADWKKDRRLDSRLREWLHESAQQLQVRFSWGAHGEFEPDFDLPTPVLQPRWDGSSSVPCEWCKSSTASEWTSWKARWVRTCLACHETHKTPTW